MPMQFAGIILEGGIVGYDQSTTSGGVGQRIFGIGKQTQWSTDTVTVSLRAISVNTGKVLATVTVQKTILSSADSVTALKFYDAGTRAFEAEAGMNINEPGTYATKAAIEMAVVELIKEGQRKGIWTFKTIEGSNTPPPAAAPVEQPRQPVISSEIKKPEEKRDELVQSQTNTASQTAPEPAPVQQQSGDGKAANGNGTESKTVTQESKAEKTVVSKGKTNVRETNQAGSTIIAVLEPGQAVKVLKEEEVLYLVELDSGKKGWVLKDAVK
jgi:curli production assembly/transport component CsgG